MEKEFVPYEEALALKELGFDEPCFAFYQIEDHEDAPIMVDDPQQYRISGFRTCKNSEIPDHYTSAPTYSQAFRWFRKNYSNLDFAVGKIYDGSNTNYHYHINLIWEYFVGTYEEAELACLKRLIERVKQK